MAKQPPRKQQEIGEAGSDDGAGEHQGAQPTNDSSSTSAEYTAPTEQRKKTPAKRQPAQQTKQPKAAQGAGKPTA